jgi:hypothetical protein
MAVVLAIAPFPFEVILVVLGALALIAVAYLIVRHWW